MFPDRGTRSPYSWAVLMGLPSRRKSFLVREKGGWGGWGPHGGGSTHIGAMWHGGAPHGGAPKGGQARWWGISSSHPYVAFGGKILRGGPFWDFITPCLYPLLHL